ncbi:hypothetical protein CEE37_00705 [candidate division LCP-89 bacterium B3_LCP]|uniref:Magnesium transporter MgtE intracellular domain-containing protein n=1 Tax=candidate division LCP-89 bacterium B3_LCP TaxID=2012998 RepID=A0A532V4X3_UNCL8|nr:MAG: hypothetical protein CEE37_00705 [candidate division LCP-89 bacterium B3_LCP]
MADENINEIPEEGAPEAASGEEKSGIKLPILLGAIGLLFVLSIAGNFIYMKMTYVAPETGADELIADESHTGHRMELGDGESHGDMEPEEEGPMMTMDLSEEADNVVPGIQTLDVAHSDSITKVVADSVAREDSISTLITNLQTDKIRGDSLLVIMRQELAQVKSDLESKITKIDSVHYKQSLKLAKIVENMPAEEAAKMLESLNDEMVIRILMRLKQRQAAKIMAEFSTSKSARLSEVIMKPIIQG